MEKKILCSLNCPFSIFLIIYQQLLGFNTDLARLCRYLYMILFTVQAFTAVLACNYMYYNKAHSETSASVINVLHIDHYAKLVWVFFCLFSFFFFFSHYLF